ncbi:protein-L-isoaspartate(D-aspartate) O-methyltransferase [Chitinivorax tropicus]|uniref:Protein-L-isoaspartate O-methyltransferase n=1 Tax=Chitinivorax tropicus TaxID=714531 RepID=A0A840MGP9_9PROT|nr:protein-L-isoaspartate(D-aspartate) O-methyltransferase [Chitinivorax tropicus]MBB5017828.1 protein-L-isoaspartate(D-aspartate) O-methyltransferase [Chitinivorax tropicus]
MKTPDHRGIGMTSPRTRLRMVDKLRQEGIRDEAVLGVMADIPRHIFVDEALAHRAYENVALPLGFGQTISQPYIVGRMTELVRSGQALDKVLEIGTGCAYQTCILSKLAREVYSIERISGLLDKARQHLRELRIMNVRLKHGDGHLGIPEAAPFDAIMMTAAASHVPQPLLDQLKIGGKLVLPLGTQDQYLYMIERTTEGFTETKLEAVKFVPLLSGTA